jgi:hypothetical protein
MCILDIVRMNSIKMLTSVATNLSGVVNITKARQVLRDRSRIVLGSVGRVCFNAEHIELHLLPIYRPKYFELATLPSV